MGKPSSPLVQSSFNPSSWTARFRSPEAIPAAATEVNEDDSGNGSGSDGSDDEVEVEDLLWGAQVSLHWLVWERDRGDERVREMESMPPIRRGGLLPSNTGKGRQCSSSRSTV